MKRKGNLLRNRKGSAILSAVIIMVVLALLGIAVTTMSLSTLQKNNTDMSNNEAYYASESGVASAIEHLKYEVISYYKLMSDAEGTDYSYLYNNFFTGINSNAQVNFIEPDIDEVSTQTLFYTGNFDDTDNVCEFRIVCVSTTADDSKYQVEANVYVKKIDIKASSSGEFVLIDNAAIIAGNLLDISKHSGFTVNGGDVIVKDITYNSSWVPYTINGGALYLNPVIGNSVKNILNYQSYSDPVISESKFYCRR